MDRTEEKIAFVPVETPEQISELCSLAAEIWRQHFTPIIGADQVEYMLEKFQSPAASLPPGIFYRIGNFVSIR